MSWIGLGVAAVGAVGGAISKGKASKAAREALANRPKYAVDESVKQRLGLAQTQLQGRAPGAAEAERNIYQTEANTQANINRAATDPMQAILGAGAIQGQTNQSFGELGAQETADYQRRYGNLSGAQEAMTAEKQREWGWNVQGQYQDTVAANAAIAQNRANTWKDVVGLGTAAATTMANNGITLGGKGKGIDPAKAAKNMVNMGLPTSNRGMEVQTMPGATSPMQTQAQMQAQQQQQDNAFNKFTSASNTPEYLSPWTSPYKQKSIGNWWR